MYMIRLFNNKINEILLLEYIFRHATNFIHKKRVKNIVGVNMP